MDRSTLTGNKDMNSSGLTMIGRLIALLLEEQDVIIEDK